MDGLLVAALRYAAAGIAVMPLHTPTPTGCSCRDGITCGSPGKHPRLRHGVLDASTEPRVIRWWWRRWPDANIGIATGTIVDVCDIDTEAGLISILDLVHGERPPGPVVRSGLGWHLWLAATGLPSRVGVVPGVDWRGRGGSAVAPPSRHASGRRYQFQRPWNGGPLPDCPPELRRLLTPPERAATVPARTITDLTRYAQAALDGEISRILAAPRPVIRNGRRLAAGGRNTALHLAAFRLGQLAALGELDQADVWAQLTDAALTVGLPRPEVRRTIASGWRAGLRHPRDR
jgi:hypothetical protein